MAGLGGVEARRMFGGRGVFRAGLMFALIADDMLYFKTDEANVGRFEGRGLPPFTYLAKGERKSLRYFQAPPEVFDEAQAMTEWARDAFECALRNQKPKAAKPKSAARKKASR
ncbi:TfoX/Sxy family protein [Caenimonas sedimenti]|uniref:TfoX/Sxy family protein n=2 Tax=Caenimonas sedimenti TaxID=2596921 RepID=A0A562ZWW7_9BURK|nr:TfoX/Sxy family protein [Caenimonas sedimenti]